MPLTNYFNNTGGANLTDSPLFIKDEQATGQSYNYDYTQKGVITKVLGHKLLNTVADTQLRTLGLSQYYNVSGTTKTILREAGTKIQVFDPDLFSFTNQSEDTATPNSDFLASGSTQQVVSVPFNASTGAVTWLAGGGMASVYGYTGSNVTKNGTAAPTGTITATRAADSGTFVATGTYFYAVVFRKTGTQALSNAALDVSATVTVVTDKVTIDLTGISNNDTTKYDKIYIYRSAVSGVTGFTVGDLIAQVNSNTTSYDDTGTSIASTQPIPRAGSVTLDNSVLPAGTYNTIASFKRRLITASGSTIYLSDLNKPESWPTFNTIKIPSGGPITALYSIGFNSPFSQGADEFLVIFKEQETWIVTGLDSSDWELKFVDSVGCVTQALIISFNGFLSWIDYRGIYIWDGAGKPIYTSRPIEGLFQADGDLDKTKLALGWGVYYRKQNQLHWRVSHRTMGENAITIKMDTRLTVPQVQQEVDTKVLEGVFILDSERALYAGITYIPSGGQEVFLSGDASGFMYKLYSAATNPSNGIQFTYETRPLDMGSPAVKKRFKKVIVWLERLVDKDLTMYYWTDLRVRNDQRSVVKDTMQPANTNAASLWDVAYWDIALWDEYQADIGTLTFYLHSQENNAEGDTLKIRLEQLEDSAPVRIHGFTIDWEPVGDVR